MSGRLRYLWRLPTLWLKEQWLLRYWYQLEQWVLSYSHQCLMNSAPCYSPALSLSSVTILSKPC